MANVLSYLYIIGLVHYMKESKAVLAEETLKYVCSGDSIQLFRNVTIDKSDIVASLYIKASNERILSTWTSTKTTINEGYTTKVFLDKDGDIWIRNVSPSDEAQYILITGQGTNFVRYNVTLSVQVAPTINCIPSIMRVDDVLVASLNAKECGKPIVSVDWLHYSGIQKEANEFIVPKTNKYGTYYACISGPALKCAKTSKLSDYCSAYAISESQDGPDVSGKPGIEYSLPTYVLVMLAANLLVLVLVICRMLLTLRRKCSNGAKDEEKSNYSIVHTTAEYQM